MPVDPGPCRWQLPDPATAPRGVDLLAVGGDLEPATLLAGYRRGLFAMHVSPDLLGWYSPDPRGTLPPADVHVSRSLRRSLRGFQVSTNRCFDVVVGCCADPRRRDGWITDDYRATYRRLHAMGWAHSIEIWHHGRLAGGLFGIAIGGLFAGESMFHHVTDASKAAVVALAAVQRRTPGERLIDVQWSTPHLARLGVVEQARPDYLRTLAAAMPSPPAAGLGAGPPTPPTDLLDLL